MLQIASDLHLEFHGKKTPEQQDELFDSIIVPKAPVLALLGDIGIPTHPIYRRFLFHQAERFEAVLVLAGNHEFYDVQAPGPAQKPSNMTWSEFCARQGSVKHSVQHMKDALSTICADHPRLHFVDNTCVRFGEEVNAPALLCSTLWSHIPDHAMDQVRHSLNDYAMVYLRMDGEICSTGKLNTFTDWCGSRLCQLTPSHTSRWHEEAVQWLREEISRLRRNGCEHVGMLTHHAPSMQGSSLPLHEAEGNAVNHAFATDLEDIYQAPIVRFWAYGHTHFNNDRVVRGARLVSNQFGYEGEEVGVAYRPDFTIDLKIDNEDTVATSS